MPKCQYEKCRKLTNTSFNAGRRTYFYCEDHKDLLYKQVPGRSFKPERKPKAQEPGQKA